MINIGLLRTILIIKEIINNNLIINPSIKKVISVGSGNGFLEYNLQTRILDLEFICIDPNPIGFLPESRVYFKPQYRI